MKRLVILIIFAVVAVSTAYSQISFDLEAGIAITGYNNVRIPNNYANDKFSFKDDLQSDPVFAYRGNLHYRIKNQHRLTLVYAPLTIKPSGKFSEPVSFQGVEYSADSEIDAVYRFDSYRLQYRYYFREPYFVLKGIGLTAKIRDAEISLKSTEHDKSKRNTGFVPIINFLLEQQISSGLDIILDGDALFSPYGRAADLLFAMSYRINDRYILRGGYRLLEGGSNVDEVYTFALINYFVLNLKISI